MKREQVFRRDAFWKRMSAANLMELDVAMAITQIGRLKKIPVDWPASFMGDWLVGVFRLTFCDGRGSEYHLRALRFINEDEGYRPVGPPCYPPIDREVCTIEPRFVFLPWPSRKRDVTAERFFE